MLGCVIRLVQLWGQSIHNSGEHQQGYLKKTNLIMVAAVAVCWAHLAVHESLQLQLSDAKLPVLFSQTPAGLSKVELGSPHHTHVLWGLTQLQLVCTLQLEVLKTPGGQKDNVLFYTCSTSLQQWMCVSADVRPDQDVELFTLHLHVILLLV